MRRFPLCSVQPVTALKETETDYLSSLGRSTSESRSGFKESSFSGAGGEEGGFFII